ncbi:hypothetical protein V1389_02890 [Flavobacterium rakeshii]|uniref:hypothetical protein n=1 Tax=Flavobacterium rakeshii TaxID=1038845 RepID=UPI002E7BE907|nr:hypothetical protein [Flavobacterium rakeshii]MEE1897266.1 hypothetical protein [Flavobacterium rakeshii]
MEAKNIIFNKLEGFIKKYYTNELIKGSIFFIGLGLLYFIFTLLVEYFLWLSTSWRTMLFWMFIAVEIFLLFRFILFPVFKLFKLQKGIDYNEASSIIGNHFSEVSDKLTNFLQLSKSSHESELLLASIEQKAKNLQPVPFANAVNFKKNLKYLPYAAIPVLLILVFTLSGNSSIFTQSFDRVVHYDKHYTPPAPFEFVIVNNSLTAQQGTDFTLRVKTVGNIVPENTMITIGDENYYLENTETGVFEYTFEKPIKNIDFQLVANNVTSQEYQLAVVAVPTISNFEMQLNFPSYLHKKAEVIRGTGNAVVPEGTQVTWKVSALATNKIEWVGKDESLLFNTTDNVFSLSKSILGNIDYQIMTSNDKVQHHEKLQYAITTIKDQYPTIEVGTAPDSLNLKNEVILGQVSDDYGLTKLQVVYYPQGNPDNAKKMVLPVKNETFDRFFYTFPQGLDVKQGVSYEYYFEVFDNDAIHNYKSSKSSVFSHRELTDDEKQNKALQEQNSNINSLEKSIKNQDKQLSDLDKLQKLNKEKSALEYKDLKKVEDFINRQKMLEEQMKEFSKKLNDNLEEFNPEKKDENKEELMKRLEKQEKEAEKNEKLLSELEKLTEKMEKEELFDKMEKFKQKSKSQTKSLEQLVELTKRYYVEKKAEQIADELQKLGEKQEQLSEDKENSAEKQEDINKEFDKLQEEMRELEKANDDLKKPMDIPTDKNEEENIEEDMQKATDELQQDNKQGASPKQKSAGEKMKQMGGQMMQSMMSGGMDMLEEDVKMLRQILDNLLAYSFSQEDVMNQFKNTSSGSPSFSKYLIKQQDLKQQFRHVDDSLFAMSLRNPKITEEITQEVGNVHYYIDKALNDLAENIVPRGVSNQQYAVTSANKLADFLSDLLNNMQMQMQGSGQGQSKPGKGQGQGGMQLKDIIQKQQGLSEQMKKGMQKGQNEGDKPGDSKSGKKPGETGEGGTSGEGEAGDLLEIYKEQQQLREALEKALEKEGMGGNGQRALQQMKDIEKQLLNKGFKNETLNKMLNLKYELLKLDKAIQQQGEENKRQSQTNTKDFKNSSANIPDELKEYLNSIEILNRQSLPLRPNYNQRVQTYFKNND